MKYKLQDLIDTEHFQNLQDRLNEIYFFPSAIIDNDGNILTATGWQDICVEFHRKNKESEKLCIQSDQYIKDHIHEANPGVSYRCPLGLVDNATPIIIDGINYGSFFTGQFFLEEPDMVFFRDQARKYGFDEDAYLEAVKKVPIWTQAQLDNYLFFIKGLIAVISESGLKKQREIENQKLLEASQKRHRSILQSAMEGYCLTDAPGRLIEVNDAYCRMSGYSEDELLMMRFHDLEAVESPQFVAGRIQRVIEIGSDRFESKHRRKNGTVFDVEVSIQFRTEEDGQCVCFIRNITERKQAEEAVRTAHDRLEVALAGGGLGTWEWVVPTGEMILNDRWQTMLGFEPGEVGLRLECAHELTDPEALPRLRRQMQAHLDDETHYYEAVYRMRHKSGKWVWVHDRGQVTERSSDGSPLRVCGTHADVTPLMQAQEDLKKAARDWQNTFNAVSDAIWLLDKDQRIIQANKASEKIFKRKIEEIIGRHCWKIAHGTDQPITGCPLQQTSHSLKRETMDFQIEQTWFQVTTDPIFDKNSMYKGAVHLVRDITERKQSEEALRESNQKFHSMVDNIGIGVAMISPEMEVLELNRQMREWFPDAIPGQGTICYQAFHDPPSDRICSYCPICRTLQDGKVHESVSKIPFGSSFRNFRIISSPIVDKNGEIKAAIEMVEDITEKLKIENHLRQSQKMESIGNLAGGIAHDFNNILTSIIGFTELALDETPKGTMTEDSLQEVYTAGKRAKDLVQQILAFARQSDEKKTLLQPSKIAKEVLKFIRSTTPSTIEIQQNLDGDYWIMGNATQIHKVFMNLCTNAANAMEDSGGVLTVSIKDLSLGKEDSPIDMKAGDYVEIKVTDIGLGIAPEIIDSIFEPYFTTKGPGEGTGMGLAMVQGVVESYDGKISVASQLGKGTTFTIFLPMAEKPSGLNTYEPELLPTGTEHILFVDDEHSIAKMGSRTLESLGYSVTARTSSVEALELFQAKPNDFDLVVTDMTMPNMTGDQLSIELMKIKPDLPVILCTGYSNKIFEDHAAEIGIKAFAYKPIVKADWARTVRAVLDEVISSTQG